MDWKLISGLESGLSQTATKSALFTNQDLVFNFPIDATFKSTNVFGWPRLAISLYGIDFLGRDVARGYASVMIPLTSGDHTLEVTTYVPLASSMFNEWASWIMGNPPEVSPFPFPRISLTLCSSLTRGSCVRGRAERSRECGLRGPCVFD